MKRSLIAIAAAGALAVVLAGGAFFALKFTASGAVVGPIYMSTIPGNPDSGVTAWTIIQDGSGPYTGLTLGSAAASGITAWDYPAMNPPGHVAVAYFSAKNCSLAAQEAALVTTPLGPTGADIRIHDSTPLGAPPGGATKSGALITLSNTPYLGTTAPILSAGIVVLNADFQCGDNIDSDTGDADGAINDGCAETTGSAVDLSTCAAAACPDTDGERPWETCDIDVDGMVNDGCPQVGGTPEVVVSPLPPDPADSQFLACGNLDGSDVTGWEGKLGADWKLLVFEFAIDADPWGDGVGDYPCKDIDATNSVDVGDEHEVAICTVNEPEKGAGGIDDVIGFEFVLNYDVDLNECAAQKTPPRQRMNCADDLSGKCKDDNPDINTGSYLGSGVPTTPNLGDGWDCSGGVGAQPECGTVPGVAKAICGSATGPYYSGGLSPFPLAVVMFKAKAAGTDTMVTQDNVWAGNDTGEADPPPESVSADVEKVPGPTKTPTPLPPAGVRMEKVPNSAILWLMADGCQDEDQAKDGKGCLLIEKWVYAACDRESPNSDRVEGVGAWEEQIKYDHKIVRLDPKPDNTWLETNGRVANCSMTILTENWMLTGCVTTGAAQGPGAAKDCLTNPADSDGLIETIKVIPQTEDLIYRQGFRPTKGNGVVTDLVDENCEIANTLGEPIPGSDPGGLAKVCGDAHITVRMLEGDTNLDCKVNCLDEQAIAFRYGTFFGLTLYDEWYDLAPECVTYPCSTDEDQDTVLNDVCTKCTTGVPDFDIDIKDLQFVFGRDGSTCQEPIPADQGTVELPQPRLPTPTPKP
jgi:hypothetical protein